MNQKFIKRKFILFFTYEYTYNIIMLNVLTLYWSLNIQHIVKNQVSEISWAILYYL